MSLAGQIDALAGRVGEEIKAVRTEMAGMQAGGGAQQVFVQPSAPSVAAGVPFLWLQTGLGGDGNDTTLWVDDGA